MKGFQITFLLIFACIFSTQAIRHVHVYAIGYEEPITAPAGAYYDMKEQVRMQESTEELLAEYEESSAEIEALRESQSDSDPYTLRQANLDLFARHDALASELGQRESVTREIRDLWIFSIAGLFMIGVGLMLYARDLQWTGVSLMLPGFTVVDADLAAHYELPFDPDANPGLGR